MSLQACRGTAISASSTWARQRLVDGTVKRLTSSTDADTWPTWSPDGGKIAFSSFRSGKWQIWIMSSTGGSPTRITHTSYSEQMPAFSH